MLLNITETRMSSNLHALLFLFSARPLNGYLKLKLDDNLIKIKEMEVIWKEGLVLTIGETRINVKDAPDLKFVYDIPNIKSKREAHISLESLTEWYDNNGDIEELLKESIANSEKTNVNYVVYSKLAVSDTIENSIEILCSEAAQNGKKVISHNVVPVNTTIFLVTVLAK